MEKTIFLKWFFSFKNKNDVFENLKKPLTTWGSAVLFAHTPVTTMAQKANKYKLSTSAGKLSLVLSFLLSFFLPQFANAQVSTYTFAQS